MKTLFKTTSEVKCRGIFQNIPTRINGQEVSVKPNDFLPEPEEASLIEGVVSEKDVVAGKEDVEEIIKSFDNFDIGKTKINPEGMPGIFLKLCRYLNILLDEDDKKENKEIDKSGSDSSFFEKTIKFGKNVLDNAKMLLGVDEGGNKNLITKFHKAAGLNAGPGTPWCASFVSYVLKESGISVEGSARARDWLGKGIPVEKSNLKKGDIIIFARGKNPDEGHLGFFEKWSANGSPIIVAGNTNDKVEIYEERGTVLGYRRFVA